VGWAFQTIAGTRFPNEFCAEMPEGERDRAVGLPEAVIRVDSILKRLIESMMTEVAKYDALMKQN